MPAVHLIYSPSYTSARVFALHHDLMPGDWAWLRDTGVLRQHARADVHLAPRWETHPQRAQIDAALQRAARDHRLGAVSDDSRGSTTLGVSGA